MTHPGFQGASMRALRVFEAGSSGFLKPPPSLHARETQRSARSTQTLSLSRGPTTIPDCHLGERMNGHCESDVCGVYMCMVIVCVCDGDTEPWTKIRPTTLGRGNPAQRTGQYLGQGKRSPSNKPYLQRVTEWTRRLMRSTSKTLWARFLVCRSTLRVRF